MLTAIKTQPVTCTLIALNVACAVGEFMTGAWIGAALSAMIVGGLAALLD